MVVGSVLDVRRGRRYENFFGIPVPIIPWVIFLEKQWPYSQKIQYFKDVVRKLLFNDYFLGLKYWGNAEKMYEECRVGFSSKDLFFPEKIEF